jgi:hypothetical protein
LVALYVSDEQAESVLTRFEAHEKKGAFYTALLNLADVFTTSMDLSANHTKSIVSRSLDIIHVTSALIMGANLFFTFDTKQSQLAVAAGFENERVREVIEGIPS